MNPTLLRKYNVPAPRYTSYPTVPYWDEIAPSPQQWQEAVLHSFQASEGKEISIYIHLPYCEKLCTYCGCNKRITIQHAVEQPYIETLLKEWQMYVDLLGEKPVIREIHLGGGTPTFFSPENLKYLIQSILNDSQPSEEHEFSFEAHPGNTTREHLQALYEVGFTRMSLGIQDFTPEVLKIINRAQTKQDVHDVTNWAREIGYTSINFDIIYGLPLQTRETMRQNIEEVLKLRPDRIAFYSYAHIPWKQKSQRAFSEKDLPAKEEKRALYELGLEMLEANGYHEIGMDHFALESDSLYQALQSHNLHRNFMGYTTQHTDLLIGLGASAISDAWGAFAQNEKKVEEYQKRINAGEMPIIKGHILNQEDLVIRQHILNLMCQFETTWVQPQTQCDALYEGLSRMDELEADGLIERDTYSIRVTEAGQPLVRNVCMPLDARLWRKKKQEKMFSSAI